MKDKFSVAPDGKKAKDAGYTTGMTGKNGFEGTPNFETGLIEKKSGAMPLQNVNRMTPECGEFGGC